MNAPRDGAARIVVVGGGVSGLAAAWRLLDEGRARGLAPEVVVLEAEARAGGKIRTELDHGFRVEAGPNGFLTGRTETLDLARSLGIEDEVIEASPAAKHRYLFDGGALRALPGGPVGFLKTPLLSARGKLRALGEPFVRTPPPGGDESLADLVRRRVGPEVVEALVDPMVAGVYAGDPEELSAASSFPMLVELEREGGSFLVGMRARARARRTAAAAGATDAAGANETTRARPGSSSLASFRGGMQTLTDALARALGDRVRLGAAVLAVERGARGFRLHVQGGEPLDADAVLLGCPARATASLLADSAPAAARAALEIPYAPATVIGLGYERDQIAHPLDGFGFLVPKRAGRRILGTLWSSSIYPSHRAPTGHVLLRTIVGGARQPAVAELDDEHLLAVVQRELGEILGIRGEPAMRRIIRWKQAIPQYTVGHGERVARAEAAVAELGAIRLGGNAYRGVALNDCTREALRLARELLDRVAAST